MDADTPIANVEAEASLLGALMQEASLIDGVCDLLAPTAFSLPLHSRIYEAIVRERNLGKTPTPVLLKPYFDGDEDMRELGGSAYLARLTANMHGLLNPRELTQQIGDLARRRRISDALKEALEDCSDLDANFADIVSKVDAAIDMRGGDTLVESDAAETMQATLADLDAESKGVTCGQIEKLDRLLGKLEPKNLTIVAGRPGMGKAQPLDAKVLTPMGWTTMADLRVGDPVASVDGLTSSVTGIFPQGEKQVFRVTFSDGRSTECCAEHLWSVRYRDWDENRVLSTEKIAEMLTRVRYKGRLSIDLMTGGWGPNSPLPLDPWLLGLIIGDGNLCSGQVRFSTCDQEIVDRVQALLPDDLQARPAGGVDYRISGGMRGGSPNAVKDALENLGLFGLRGHEKFIPACYMCSSTDQRWELLRGLMDSDGWAEKFSAIRFSSASQRLAINVQELVRSLGGVCSIRAQAKSFTYRGERKQGRTAFICRIRLPDGRRAFSLERKIARAGRISNTVRLSITSIEPTRVTQTQCIAVSHPKRLYVTDDYIVTHNTAVAVSYSVGAARRGYGTLFVSLEMSREQLGKRQIADVCFDDPDRRVPHNKIRDRDLTHWERERVQLAARSIAALPLVTIDVGALRVGRLKRLVRTWKRRMVARGQKLDLVVVDYLQLLHPDEKKRSAYEAISEISTALKQIAKDEDVHVMALAQLSRSVEARTDKRPMMSDLRDSGQIEQDADTILMLLREEYYLRQAEPNDDFDKHERWEAAMERCRGVIEFIVPKARHGAGGSARGRFYGPYQAVR